MENIFLQRLRLAKALVPFHEEFYQKLINCQYKYIKEAFEYPEKFIYIDYFVPSEIFFAMDLVPVMSEHSINFLASLGLVDDLLREANEDLQDSGTCSFHKPMIPIFKKNIFPKPLLFATTSLCNEAAMCFSYTAKQIDTNYFCVDLPYSRTEESIKYVAKQYEKLVYKLEKITGHRFDIDKLRETIKKSNVMRNYLVNGNDIRKKNPALISGSDMLRFGGHFCYHGTDEGIDIAKSYYEYLKNKNENRDYLHSKYRILWCHLRPFYENKFFEFIEKELGATIVCEEMNYIFWDELEANDPFLAMAHKTVDWLFCGNVERRLHNIRNIIRDYSIDGVINFSHVNCRVLNPKLFFLKREFEKLDITFLELIGDCIDRNNFSKEQLLTRVEAFCEVLEGRKNDLHI